MPRTKVSRCISCGLLVEWTTWATGPVCHPCYWAAKLLYESGITDLSRLHPALREQLRSIFEKNGHVWPDSLIKAMEARSFEKTITGNMRWWSATPEQMAKDYEQMPEREKKLVPDSWWQQLGLKI